MTNRCRAFLHALRVTSSRKVRQQFRKAAVLGDSGLGFTVELDDGTQLYVGRTHCRYCARAEALGKLTGGAL